MSENEFPFVLPLAACQDVARVGGKAINLARLIQGGFDVPGGFVVTTAAFLSARGNGMPDAISAEILAAYRGMASPTVAVRSSATAEDLADASMAGQYETILDVSGEKDLLDAVLRCWQSIDTPRTRAYLAEKQIPFGKVAMGVVVQELVAADVAGVMFTENPQGAAGEMLIEANWGLGESVVSGLAQPDNLVIDRATGRVKNFRIGEKALWIEPGRGEQPVPEERRNIPCLNSRDVENLRRLGLKVSEHFGSAQDTEWAIRDGRLHLLQSRSITTLEDAEEQAEALRDARAFLHSAKDAGRGDWVRHNLAETLPHPCRLTWSVVRRFMGGDGGFGNLYREVGFEPSEAVRREGFLDLVGGRIYMDLSRAPEMFFENFPFRYDPELLAKNADAAQDPPTLSTGSPLARMRIAPRLGKVRGRMAELARDFDKRFENEIVPAFEVRVADEMNRDLAALSATEWVALFRERERLVMDEFGPQSLLPGMIAGMALDDLRTFLSEHFWDESAAELANELAGAARADRTVRSTEGLHKLAAGELDLEMWLEEYGHRAPGEFDLATPRWNERPEGVAAMAAHLKGGANPGELHGKRATAARERAKELEEKLSPHDRREFRRRLDLVTRYLPFREDGKHHLMSGYRLIRAMALEAGRRLEIGDDVFFLSGSELHDAVLSGFAPLHLIEKRRQRRAAESRLSLPSLINAEGIEKLGEPAPVPETDAVLPAFSLSTGSAAGPVAVVLRPEDAGELGRGYVLVCPSTDPNWTPLFVNASALVLERGGSLSHGAIVAREMGLPAVVLENATRLFCQGETIRVDGHRGFVTRGEMEPDDLPEARIAADRIPPPPGERERGANKLRNWFLVFWSLYFIAAFLLPAAWVKEPSLRLLDALLLPLVAAFGRPGTVAVIALALAVLSLVGQKLLTDNRRLLVAKKRAAALRKDAAKLPADSPLRKEMLALARPVQTRVMMASFVPLALILGPMVMSFTWLPLRLDPASWNAEPGATVHVRATVDGDYAGEVSISPDPSLRLGGHTPTAQGIPQIRPVLGKLLVRWRTEGKLPEDTPWPARAAAEAARTDTLASLGEYLKGPMPEQTVFWTLESSPEKGGRFPLKLEAGGKTVTVPAVLGIAARPAPKTLCEDGRGMIQRTEVVDSPIRAVEVTYKQQVTRAGQVFWEPVEFLVKPWLSGWLLVYLLVYLPAMILLRAVLRIA